VPSIEVKQRLAQDVALWQADGIIDAATRRTLQERYDTPGFGLLSAVKYLGIAGGMLAAFGLLGFVAAMSSSEAVGSALLAAVAGFLARAGLRLGRDARARYVYSSQIVLALGVFGWAGAVGIGCDALHMQAEGTTLVVGLGVLPLAFVIAYRERNSFVLLLGTLGVLHWIGACTHMYGHNGYELEIDQPRVIAPIAAAIFAFGVWHQRFPGRFGVVYQSVALIYLNLSLLILSDYPRSTSEPWIVVFTAVALAQIILGARLKSALVMGFGVTAVALDLFTRYFEHVWDHMSEGLFFVVGGLLMMAFGAAVERSYRLWKR
jgi:uncharacterized membrane protein